MTADPSLGLVFAVVRRVREIIWIAAGIGLWSFADLAADIDPSAEAVPEAQGP